MRILLCLLLLPLAACGVQGPLTLPKEQAAAAPAKKQVVPVKPSRRSNPDVQDDPLAAQQQELQSPPFMVNEEGDYEIRGNVTER